MKVLTIILAFFIAIYVLSNAGISTPSANDYPTKQKPNFLSSSTYEDVCHDAGWMIKQGGNDAKELIDYLMGEKMLNSSDLNYLGSNNVCIGCSRCLMFANIGDPESTNKTTNTYGEHIQNVYKNKYIYTDNNVITTIQE